MNSIIALEIKVINSHKELMNQIETEEKNEVLQLANKNEPERNEISNY